MSVLVLKSSFASAHLYHQPLWSEEKNRETFGRCYTTHGHGHNYVLEVGFQHDESSTLPAVHEKQERLDKLTRVLDHEHLNFVIPEFKEKIPTSENIALYFYEKLKTDEVSFLRVYESPDLWAEVRP